MVLACVFLIFTGTVYFVDRVHPVRLELYRVCAAAFVSAIVVFV